MMSKCVSSTLSKAHTQSKTNLFLHGHGVPEVDGHLSDVDEGVLVRGLCVQGIHLC